MVYSSYEDIVLIDYSHVNYIEKSLRALGPHYRSDGQFENRVQVSV
jgi:hypothetical protein